MVPYLINATLIWAACLLVYEVLLRQETYHRWNRLYLLLSAGAGIVIPLISMPHTVPVVLQSKSIPALAYHPAAAAGTLLTDTGAPVSLPAQAGSWLWLVYITGALISAALLVRGAGHLLLAYRSGRKARQGKFIIIETGRRQPPCSFMNLVFISSTADYSDAELRMLLEHECRHGRLLHSLDLLFMRLLQVVLWFHPLIHRYRHCLQLVHEYQADEIARDNFTAYGTFLLEQQLMSTSSLLAHSFHHSPIKNRIIMLTKNASAGAGMVKYLIAVPMICTFMLVCTGRSFSHERVRKGNRETFKGNVFEYAGPDKDQTIKSDNGEVATITIIGGPVKINGEKIYAYNQVAQKPVFSGDDMVQMVFNKIQGRLAQLPDGEYHMAIFSPVVDKNGGVAYYNVRGVELPGTPFGEPLPADPVKIDDAMQQEFIKDIESALDHMHFTPARVKGKAVAAELDNDPFFNRKIIVRNHQAVLQS